MGALSPGEKVGCGLLSLSPVASSRARSDSSCCLISASLEMPGFLTQGFLEMGTGPAEQDHNPACFVSWSRDVRAVWSSSAPRSSTVFLACFVTAGNYSTSLATPFPLPPAMDYLQWYFWEHRAHLSVVLECQAMKILVRWVCNWNDFWN